jgi:glycine reductase
MTGPGAAYSPFSRTANVALVATPAPGVDRAGYHNALRTAGLKASTYLANAAENTEPDEIDTYDLPDASSPAANIPGLPRVAYVYMVHSNQNPAEPDEPILYGNNVRGLLPTVLHPNEVLDGAVLCGYWNLGMLTHTIQNHPVITELYARHGVDLNFVGVIATVADHTLRDRERTATMVAQLAKYTLAADGVILTKAGGGIPETALMLACEQCEDLGIKTAIAINPMVADDGKTTLTFHSPKADAVAIMGLTNAMVKLPAVSRVIGAQMIGPFSQGATEPVPANSAVEVRIATFPGGMDQLGGSQLRTVEY